MYYSWSRFLRRCVEQQEDSTNCCAENCLADYQNAFLRGCQFVPDTRGMDKTLVFGSLVHVSPGIHNRTYEDKQWSWVWCKYPNKSNMLHALWGFLEATPSRIADKNTALFCLRFRETELGLAYYLKQRIRSLWDRVIFAQRLTVYISILFIIVYFLYQSVLKSIP